MKKLSIALLAISLLLPAGMAQAFAIYNHVGHEVCVSTEWTPVFFKSCKFKIPAHSTHNGGHGDSLSHAYVGWKEGDDKYMSNLDDFDIPHGGYARIYEGVVKVYKHDGKHIESRKITNTLPGKGR